MTIDLADRFAIHELLALYGHLIDQRCWDELGQVFTTDVLYDATDFGQPITKAMVSDMDSGPRAISSMVSPTLMSSQ